MRILITGHTGFKGSWLSILLASRGHEVSGIALDPPEGGLYNSARVAELLADDIRLDIRNASELANAVERLDPELVLHLAAQPLVRESYADPRTTFETNVMGTLNVLEALRRAPSLRAAVIVTTDKVYRNVGRTEGYAENEALGGDDPYSSSKAMADLLTQSWVTSFPGVPTAIARAGNVIGGGDVSKDRLMVDLVAGLESGVPVSIRYPQAVRPWQHVLDCLSGYVTLAGSLLEGGEAGAWNFGPDAGGFHTVGEIADTAVAEWSGETGWVDASAGSHLHEAALLTLDATKAQRELGWRNELPFPQSVAWTIEWYKSVARGADAREATVAQLDRFAALAPDAPWLRALNL
jgi:CDP-glucose 4,6-dehydratase